MDKTNMEKHGNTQLDFLFWIKEYIGAKIHVLKPIKGTKEFSRVMEHTRILNSRNIDELRDNANTTAQSISGLRNYSTPLIAFYNYVACDKEIITLRKIDTSYINTYVTQNKVSSNYYIQLRSLFKFIDSNILDDFKFNIGYKKDGTRAATPIKMNKEKIYSFLDSKDFENFTSFISKYKSNHPNSFLLKLMMRFLCYGGLKADEVQQLKESDISFKDISKKNYMQIRILGKENKEKTVFILYDLIKDDYENYLKIKKDSKHDCVYLFYTRTFEMFSDKRIYDIVKDFHVKSGLKIENFSSNSLRRSYAAILHSQSVPFEKISLILGLNPDETIELYTFVSRRKNL